MVHLENKEIVLNNGIRFNSYGIPELETISVLDKHFAEEVGGHLLLLLGFQGAGKTTIAREMARLGKAIQVPVRVTRIIRSDELRYKEETDLDEIIPMNVETFMQKSDFLSVRLFNNSYYGIALEDVVQVNNMRKQLGEKTKMIIAICGLWDVFRLREIFPSMKVVYISAPTSLRQKRIDKQIRPSGQNLAQQDGETVRSEACLAIADFVVHNASLSREKLFEIFSAYLTR